MGWFYGFKLHSVIHQYEEIARSALSNGHITDIKMVNQWVDGLQANLFQIVSILLRI